MSKKKGRHRSLDKDLNRTVNLGDMKNVIKQPEYFGPRMLGSYLGSGPGEGSMVKINLGVID